MVMGFLRGIFSGEQTHENELPKSTGSGSVNSLVEVHVDGAVAEKLTESGASAQQIYDAALATALINRSTVRISDVTKVDQNGPTVLPM